MENQVSKFSDLLEVIKTLLDEYRNGKHEWLEDWCFDCRSCRTPTQLLYRCSACHLVSYCDRFCQIRDRTNHKYVCREFPVVNGRNVLYTTAPWGKHLAELRERAARLPKSEIVLDLGDMFKRPRVCHNCWQTGSKHMTYCKCICVSYCSATCAIDDIHHKKKCEHLRNVLCLSYPMSIFNALQELSARLHQGSDECSIHDMDTLTIHIVDSSPIVDSRAWEDFMASFPKLKKLNVVFIIQHKWLKESFILNYPDVMVKTCTIAYSIQQMNYHKFFSSNDYTEPDVVVVFRCTYEMDFIYGDNVPHTEMSYRKMVFSSKTILILTDTTKEALNSEVKDVNAIQPMVQLVPPWVNPIKEAISNEEPDIDSACDFLNERKYFTCLRKK